jgi:hypothetical protein
MRSALAFRRELCRQIFRDDRVVGRFDDRAENRSGSTARQRHQSALAFPCSSTGRASFACAVMPGLEDIQSERVVLRDGSVASIRATSAENAGARGIFRAAVAGFPVSAVLLGREPPGG